MTTMNFDPTLRAATVSGTTNSSATTDVTGGAAVTTTAETSTTTGKLVACEGFLKKAGHIANVVLSDLVKYVIPVAQVTALVDPAVLPAVTAFTTAVQLVQSTVLSAEQRWAAEGSTADTEKLADVLTVVEQPIITLFAQAGLVVSTDYVVNLVNGVVAMLNAQPGSTLAVTGTTTTTAAS